MLRIGLTILISCLALLQLLGCGGSGNEELTFVERSRGSAGGDAQEQQTDELEISSGQQQPVRLLVLPFITANRDPNIELFISGLPDVIKKLFDKDRFIQAETIGRNAYRALAIRTSRRGFPVTGRSIAEEACNEFKADLILFGRIEIGERNVLIEPKLLSYDGRRIEEEDLPAMEVHLSNIMQFVNPLTENIKDHLSQRQR